MLKQVLHHPALQSLARLTFALGLVLISWLALSPHPPQGLSTGWDKANHALAFAALACCGSLGLRWRSRWLLGALMAYGLLIEILQTQVPGRSGEAADLLADGLGALAGILLVRLLMRR
jgi:VanZ family protein